MKLCRVQWEDKVCYGVIEGDHITLVEGNIFGSWRKTILHLRADGAKFFPPCQPSKIIAVGKNYKEHAAEMGGDVPAEPLLFLKAPSALIGHEDTILLPPQSQRVDYEGELAVVIGQQCAKLKSEAEARPVIFGYTCLNDVTARDLQKKDVQYTRAKSFDTFCPVGPVIETDIDPTNVGLRTRLNGEIKQSANTRTLAFNAFDLVQYVSQVMTLLPGDIISTGTPSGVGPMKPGDVVEVEIDGIGILRNTVAQA